MLSLEKTKILEQIHYVFSLAKKNPIRDLANSISKKYYAYSRFLMKPLIVLMDALLLLVINKSSNIK